MVKYIQRLKHFKIFELWEARYNVDILLEVVENLPNLNELRLERNGLSIADIKELAKCDTLTVPSFHNYSNEPLDPVDDVQFDEILRLVSKRTSGKKLTIQIRSWNTTRYPNFCDIFRTN